MRLDNRTQAILISGEAMADAQSKEAIKSYYATKGGSVEDAADGVKVSYKDKATAEKASLSPPDWGEC
jgi:hypothetical protein